MTPTSGTRERVLRAAARLFRRQGYEATGLKELVAEAEAPWGSLYHHFPGGKEQLGAEAIRVSGAGYVTSLQEVLDGSESVCAAATRMFDIAAKGLERSGFANGCPIANVASETANSSEALRAACSEVFDSWTEVIADRFRAEGLDPGQARDAAVFVVATYEGAITLARAHHDSRPMVASGALVAATLEALVASPKQHRRRPKASLSKGGRPQERRANR